MSATEAQLGLEFQLELECALQSELEYGLELELAFKFEFESEFGWVYCVSPWAHPPVTPEREGEGASSLHLGLRPLPILSCCLPPTPWPIREGWGPEGSASRPPMSAQHRPLRAGGSWA